MKAVARPPYARCAGALLLFGTLSWRIWQSVQAHGRMTATSAAFLASSLAACVAVLFFTLCLRGLRIDGDRLVATRLLPPFTVAYPLGEVELLVRRKGLLEIVLRDGARFAVHEAFHGGPAMIRLLLSDEARGDGFQPARSVSIRV